MYKVIKKGDFIRLKSWKDYKDGGWVEVIGIVRDKWIYVYFAGDNHAYYLDEDWEIK